jgi:trigger factor
MQVTETLSEGLKREFKVTLAAGDLARKVDEELTALKDKVRINGFRPGKVPKDHLKKLYGRAVMGDVIQGAVNEANKKIVDDHGLKLAFQPQIKFPEDEATVKAAFEGTGDLTYDVALEVLPVFDLADFGGIELVREVAEVPDEDVKAEIERLAKQNRGFTTRPEGAAAETGDRLTVDFVGSIDGAPFEGGKATDIKIELGAGQFIEGFEDGLKGAKAGERRTVEARFPAAYAREELAGKAASFDVTVKAVEAPDALVIDDSLAKLMGIETLANLETAVREIRGSELANLSRARLKRNLLDALEKQYTFELPPTLLQQEFDNVWNQLTAEMKSAERTFADEKTTEEEARTEYRRIAERRVRLGLVLARIGDRAEVKVTEDEVSQALIARARQFPGQEKQVWEHYRKNPEALAELRAPIFEEKVVDHILANAKVSEKKVTVAELRADPEGASGEAKDEKKD